MSAPIAPTKSAWPAVPRYRPIGEANIARLSAAQVRARLAEARAALEELKGLMIPFWRTKEKIRRDRELLVRRGLALGTEDDGGLRAELLAQMRSEWLGLIARFGGESEFLRLAAQHLLGRKGRP